MKAGRSTSGFCRPGRNWEPSAKRREVVSDSHETRWAASREPHLRRTAAVRAYVLVTDASFETTGCFQVWPLPKTAMSILKNCLVGARSCSTSPKKKVFIIKYTKQNSSMCVFIPAAARWPCRYPSCCGGVFLSSKKKKHVYDWYRLSGILLFCATCTK